MTDKNILPTHQTGHLSENEVASAAVLRVVGTDLDDSYEDVDDHPSSLDLPVRAQRSGKKPRASEPL
jgi:hypothetical protein